MESSDSELDISSNVKRKVKRYKTGLLKNYETEYVHKIRPATKFYWDSKRSNESNFPKSLNNHDEPLLSDISSSSSDIENNSNDLQELDIQYNNEEINHELTTNNHSATSNDLNSLINDSFINDETNENNSAESNSDVSSISCDDDYNANYSTTDESVEDNADSFDDTILFEKSNLSVRDVMIMVMAFSIRFQLSNIARSELINMIKIFSCNDNVNISEYRFKEAFDPPDNIIMYHYYCDKCYSKILHSTSTDNFRKAKLFCSKCNVENVITLKSDNYFISVDLVYQLQMLFRSAKIKADIFKFLDEIHEIKRNHKGELITDIHDGELYKAINTGDLTYLTYNVSTDGAPLTKSGKRGFWPLQIIPNFLPASNRFKHILLAGMLTCKKEPNSDLMNLFFSKFNEQATVLFEEGIEISNLENKTVVVKFFSLAYPVDSVCRPILQNRLQFNGYCGCSWCYHPGKYIKSVSGIRYPYVEETDADDRTHESHLYDIQTVTSSGKTSERGVKGVSSLLQIPRIDMIWSFSYDYLHGLLAGVDEHIFKQWTSPNSESGFRLTKADIVSIDKFFTSITPTQEIHRHPRAIKNRGKWKSSEIKSWVLYYSLPCLQGRLSEEALDHYSLLVRSLYTLLKRDLYKEDLLQCHEDLLKFVGLYEIYYGTENMTFNVHILIHIVKSVMKCGPIWTNSTFPFESNIYQLKQLITGPHAMDKQMTKKHLQKLHFKTGDVQYSSDEIESYCTNLFSHRKLKLHFKYSQDGVIFIGKGIINKSSTSFCKTYKKCIYQGTVFHSMKYSKTIRTTDTMVELKSEKFGQIIDILCKDEKCFLKIAKIITFENKPFTVPHIFKIQLVSQEFYEVSISDVTSKVLLVTVNNNDRYLCRIPNDLEVQ